MAYADDLRLRGFADSTIYTYTSLLKRVDFELPGTIRDAKAWLGVRRQSVSAASLCCDVRALKSYSAWWADEHGEADPLAALRHPKQPTAAPGRIADPDDVGRVYGHLKNWQRHPNNMRDYAILAVLHYTGMRRSELVRLTVDDIDFDNRRITIAAGKNGEARIVPLHDFAAVAIRRYLTRRRDTHRLRELPSLWLGRDGALRADSITKIFNRISAEAGLAQPLKSHQLRRLMAKTWVTEGGSDDALMFIAGWRSPTMPARYRAEARTDLAHLQYDRIFPDRAPTERVKPGPRATSAA
jgi:site-specific recombinase XerD